MFSVVIITHNEVDKIEKCINSLQKFTDDIVLVDANSDDATRDLAKSLGARVFIKEWEGYGQARNFGSRQAANDWILAIDADERLSKALRENLSSLRLSDQTVYEIHRVNYLGQRQMNYGFLHPERKIRLYNRNDTRWSHRTVHEVLEFKNAPAVEKIEGKLLHYSCQDLKALEAKLDQYARLTAEAWQIENRKPILLTQLLSPYWHFVKTYLLRLGFLEGIVGLKTSWAAFKYSRKKFKYYSSRIK